MNRLPSIFHNNAKVITNNKNSFNTFEDKKEIEKDDYFINIDNLINYFNKKVIIETKSQEHIEGILISKRNDMILLDTGRYINIKDINNIK